MKDPRFAVSNAWEGQETAPREELERARASASEVARGSVEMGRLDQAREVLESMPHECWAAFHETFAAIAREDEGRCRSWTTALFDDVEEVSADLTRLLLSKRGAFNFEAQVLAWREETDPFTVWENNYSAEWSVGDGRLFSQLHLLLLLDPEAWCHACDRLSYPGIMEMALFLNVHLDENREQIETLLRVSPPVFDEEGRWLPTRSVTALLVTEQIIAHAKALHRAVSAKVYSQDQAERTSARDDLAALETQELPTWMRKVLGILLARPDGRVIALGLFGRLAREELTGHHALDGQRWSAEQQAFHILAEVLASANIRIRDLRDAWVARMAMQGGKKANREINGEGARTLIGEGIPLLFGAAALLEHDSRSQEDFERFWSWFEELLVGRDPGLSLALREHARVDIPQHFGLLLSRLPEPGHRFRETYLKLEPQRRRDQFRSRYKDYDADLGSAGLIRIGLDAALNWFKLGDDDAAAQELFWENYNAARRLWLTAVNEFDRKKQPLVPLCFAYMPALFGESLGQALRRAIPPIANDPSMVSSAGWFLWKNGVPPKQLVLLLREAGADLEIALRDAHQWATLTTSEEKLRRMRGQNPEFPNDLYDLANALGISFEEPPRSEGGRRREEFARCISWGAALLRRLDDEGCTDFRFWPIESTGNTWILQAKTPPALRERFGISPEMRILVVHGQVHGRDLRVAIQEPTDAGDVDPDLLVIASDQPELAKKLPYLAGPWGQRIPWPPIDGQFAPLTERLREFLPTFDIFEYRDPIRGSALVGRRDHIERLTARLVRGEAVGVFGLRKVGKSSLLRAVAEQIDPIGARRGMFEALSVPLPSAEPEALVVSLDVQGVAGRGFSALIERLISELDERLSLAGIDKEPSAHARGFLVRSALPPVQSRPANDSARGAEAKGSSEPPAPASLEDFRRLLEIALERTLLPICFILDEYDLLFEGYDGEPGMQGVEQLFALFRSLANATQRVSLALIGRDPRFIELPLLGGFTSPLANWVMHVWLGPLRRDESDELLVRLGKRVGLEVGAATLETAWQWTGGHPLLLRQYGAALFELAHAPPTRPRPVPSDPIHEDAVELFLRRDAVYTICNEVYALLAARYPEALALVEELAGAPAHEASEVVERHGGVRARGITVLVHFGIVGGTAAAPWVPGVFREEFALVSAARPPVERSASSGS